jgi:superfamily II DNA/RNA helicase
MFFFYIKNKRKEEILNGILLMKFEKPSGIQAKTIPIILEK